MRTNRTAIVCGALFFAAAQLNAQWGAAKDKKDANVYLFGSALYGVSTKPLYIVDLKLDLRKELGDRGWWADKFVGLKSTFVTNAGAEPPNDRTEADPDSITGALSLDTTRPLGQNASLFLELLPASGEFTRKHPASNFITGGSARIVRNPFGEGRAKFTFSPLAGYEIGGNLNKPATLFKRPVDLSGYNGIARATAGANTAFYIVNANPTSANVFLLVFDAAYLARVPFTDEPFVRTAFVPGTDGKSTRQKVTTLRRNARHTIEAGMTWSINPYAGVRVQYRYGSLPPLFEFVNHQITIGFTLKAMGP